MNRMGLGLAVGAGYLLGRTKKLKMAVAVGGLVAGKKLNLSPRMVAELLQQQLRNNPQFKEIGDQLREDLRGVGKAASGAMVERQLDALSDRLHGRTAQVRDQLTGVVPGGREDDDADDEYEDEEPEGEEPEDDEPRDDESEDSASQEDEDEDEEPAAKKAPVKRPSAKKTAQKTAKKAPAKKAAKKAPAKKTAAKKTTAAKKATSGRRGGSARSRLPKGGGEG
ncbi:DNA primase [Streptomyces sp. SID5643]|uniref:DNA primase n=1 Tax=Streptomyces sp. SID5643 TaxID=2690307 RepID=UPI00136D4AEF|nr:DNA primase [Streptomyces sp. SID5643]MZF83817.1 DNA primase [Streptomyces sp. SID5643]